MTYFQRLSKPVRLFIYCLPLALVVVSVNITLTPSVAFVPLPLFLLLKEIIPLLVLPAYVLMILVLSPFNTRSLSKYAVLIIITLPCCLVSLALALFYETVLDTVLLGSDRYYLVQHVEIGDMYTSCDLYKCEQSGLDCRPIQSSGFFCMSMSNLNMVVDPEANEIHIVEGSYFNIKNRLIYTFGATPRGYPAHIWVDDTLYYLAYTENPGTSTRTFRLVKCKNTPILSCQQLPFRYSEQYPGHMGHGWYFMDSSGWLELDDVTGELRVLVDDRLVFTLGELPRCYLPGCFLSSE